MVINQNILVVSVNVVSNLDLVTTFTCVTNLPAHLVNLHIKFDLEQEVATSTFLCAIIGSYI